MPNERFCGEGELHAALLAVERPWTCVQLPSSLQGLFDSEMEALMAFGCLQAPIAARLRIWDRGAGCSLHQKLQCMPAPLWATPSWSRHGGFRAREGCGQTGSEACPRVQLRLLLADETPSLQHSFLAFHPGHPLSILALALREGFGDGGGGGSLFQLFGEWK